MGGKCACHKKLKDASTIMQGSVVVRPYDGEEYIAAQIAGGKFLLVSLASGNRWSDGSFTLYGIRDMAKRDGFMVKRHARVA